MGKRPDIRRVNGVVSACIVLFFLGHGALGTLSSVCGIDASRAVLAWAGVCVVVLHVALCVGTSRAQLTDSLHPPSAKKKRHLALKWTSGAVLAAMACAHIACNRIGGLGAPAPEATALVTAALAAALAWHVCVGAKSLLKDVGIDRRHRGVVRGVVIGCAVLFAVCALWEAAF